MNKFVLKSLIGLFILLTASCTRDFSMGPAGENYGPDARLKRKVTYGYLESTSPIYYEEYKYNADGQVAKILYYEAYNDILIHYETFYYENNMLKYMSNMHKNYNAETGYILLDSTAYIYENNLLIREISCHPQADYRDYIEYEYDGDRLYKLTKYNRNELEHFITYEYANGKIAKEYYYDAHGELYRTTMHTYNKGLLAKTELYFYDGTLLRRIQYTRDSYGHVIIEQSQEMVMYSSMMSFVVRYEYE